MRYIYRISLAIVILSAVLSCQKSNHAHESLNPEGTVSFDFIMDNSLSKASSSFGNGILSENHCLMWQIYVDDTNFTEADIVSEGTSQVVDATLGSLTIDVPKGKSYRILFLLYNKTAFNPDAIDTDDLRKIGFNYQFITTSDDSYDIFCASAVFTPGKDRTLSVTLKRPWSQINIADKVVDWAASNEYRRIAISVSNAGTHLDASTGKSIASGDVSFSPSWIYGATGSTVTDYSFEINPDYFLRSMAYVLPSEGPADITIKFLKEDGADDADAAILEVKKVNLQPNARLNILADDIIKQTI